MRKKHGQVDQALIFHESSIRVEAVLREFVN